MLTSFTKKCLHHYAEMQNEIQNSPNISRASCHLILIQLWELDFVMPGKILKFEVFFTYGVAIRSISCFSVLFFVVVVVHVHVVL